MINLFEPKIGSLLISEPFMKDPNFSRSVILLTHFDPIEGVAGLIVNQTLPITIQDILEGIPSSIQTPIFLGGPVESFSVHFVHTFGEIIENSEPLGNSLFYGGNYNQVFDLLIEGKIQEDNCKIFLGYSGWDLEQFNTEMNEKNWMVLNNYNPQLPMLHNVEDLWKESVISMGPKFAHIVNFPPDPMLN